MLNGRLRSVVTSSNGKKELDREAGRGELVGVVSIVHGAFASSTYVDRIVNIEQGDSKAPCRLNTKDSDPFKLFLDYSLL